MHKTFLVDLTEDTYFTYDPDAPAEGNDVTKEDLEKFTYHIPKGEATHYNPTFWQFDLKLAFFFSRHGLWAKLFDWTHLRDKAVLPIGFVYEKGKKEPLTPKRPKIDYALENWNIRHNTITNRRLVKVGKKIDREQHSPISWALLIGVIIIVVVVGLVLISFMTGKPDTTPIQNATVTATPLPTPIILR